MGPIRDVLLTIDNGARCTTGLLATVGNASPAQLSGDVDSPGYNGAKVGF